QPREETAARADARWRRRQDARRHPEARARRGRRRHLDRRHAAQRVRLRGHRRDDPAHAGRARRHQVAAVLTIPRPLNGIRGNARAPGPATRWAARWRGWALAAGTAENGRPWPADSPRGWQPGGPARALCLITRRSPWPPPGRPRGGAVG